MAPLDPSATATLRERFGHTDFRPGQREAVAATLAGRDAVVVLPTGGGKSLCYQLPAVLRAARGHGLTVVVSPLIALMNNQVEALRARGVPSVALHSGLDAAQRREALRDAADAALLYCSPERLALQTTRRWLTQRGVAAVAIDEAHCISEWGHDFRKDYRRLGELKALWEAPTLALTATATPRVVDDIHASLGLREPLRFVGRFARPELRFVVEHHRGDQVRVQRLIAWLEQLGLGRDAQAGRVVVYAGTRKRVTDTAKALRAVGFAAGHYHAGRTDGARATAQRRFESGELAVLVATTAFGMGIDLPDVRLVLHLDTPPTLEAYVQQAGRAGRDGREAHAVLLYAPGDAARRARRAPDPSPGARAGWRAVQDYVFGTLCRQQQIAAWFGAPSDGACGVCDVCAAPLQVEQAVAAARADGRARATARREQAAAEAAVALDEDDDDLIVEFVANLARPRGKRLVALGLRGSKAKPAIRARLADNPCFGALAHLPERALVQAVERLLASGRLAPRGRKYPTVWLPDKPVRAAGARPRRSPSRPPLERALRALRSREARRRRYKPYMVFDDATLAALIAAAPRDLDALAEVRGMGPRRVERYGEALLALFREHREDR